MSSRQRTGSWLKFQHQRSQLQHFTRKEARVSLLATPLARERRVVLRLQLRSAALPKKQTHTHTAFEDGLVAKVYRSAATHQSGCFVTT